MRQMRRQFQVSPMTVFGALKKHGYHTRYNHNAVYYTLADTPQFDDWGLWAYRNVRFSRAATLALGRARGQGSGVVFGQSHHHTANPSTKTTPDPVEPSNEMHRERGQERTGVGSRFRPIAPPHRKPLHENDS
jgi:hypothetical protein